MLTFYPPTSLKEGLDDEEESQHAAALCYYVFSFNELLRACELLFTYTNSYS